MDDRGRERAAGGWWRNLTAGWRLNIGLYALATIALVALLVSVATGGGQKPKQVQVASQARPTTTSVTLPRPATTVPSTTTTLTPTTVSGPTTTAGPGGKTTTTAKPATGVAPTDTTTTAPPVCRNSTDSRCGAFRWDPLPSNQPLTVNVASVSPAAPKSGDTVAFKVEVSDPDHAVTSNCATVDYGDTVSEPIGCVPPECGPAYGPWDPPAAQAGSQTFTYSHVYAAARSYDVKIVFHTDRDTRCPQPDPYGNTQTAGVTVVVAAPPAGP